MTEAVKQQIGKFTLKDVRMSFPNLFEAKAPPQAGGTPPFSVVEGGSPV